MSTVTAEQWKKRLDARMLLGPPLSVSNSPGSDYYEFLVEAAETPYTVTAVTENFRRWGSDDYAVYLSRSKLQKFLCVGGPWDGHRSTEQAARDQGYTRFAAAAGGRGSKTPERRNALLHSSLWSND